MKYTKDFLFLGARASSTRLQTDKSGGMQGGGEGRSREGRHSDLTSVRLYPHRIISCHTGGGMGGGLG